MGEVSEKYCSGCWESGLIKGHENPVCHPDPELDSGVSGSLGKEILKQVQHKVQNDMEAGFLDEIR